MKDKINKPFALGSLMAGGQIVQVTLDARRAFVSVPEQHTDNACLMLEIGHAMPGPLREFYVDHDGWGAVLSFGRSPFPVWAPWHAVYAMRIKDTDVGYVWAEDAPADVHVQAKKRPALVPVKIEGREELLEPEHAEMEEQNNPGAIVRPMLRVIK